MSDSVTIRIYKVDRQWLNEVQANCLIKGRRINHGSIIHYLLQGINKNNLVDKLISSELELCLTCGYEFSPYTEWNPELVCPNCGSGDIQALGSE